MTEISPPLWAAPLLIGFVGGLVFTPLARLTALRTGVIDRPVGLKIHSRATPLLGGTAVYLAFALTVVLVLPLTPPVRGVLLGGLGAVVIGVIDEVFTLTPAVHLGGQIGAAALGMACGLGAIRNLSIPMGSLTTPAFHVPMAVGVVITIFWLVGMMNTMNFLDGLDGLASGVSALAALLLAIWASEPAHYVLTVSTHHEDLLLPMALVGALCGFLPFNWHVARIFLGDSGSMFLGFALGALSIVGPAKLGTALLILLIPVLDVAWAIVRRRLGGRNFLSGDKQHVYHRMLELGMGHQRTVLSLYALCAALGVLAVQLDKAAKLFAFVVLSLAAFGGFVAMEIRATGSESSMRRQRSGGSRGSSGPGK